MLPTLEMFWFFLDNFGVHENSRLKMFYKNGFVKILAKYTRKYLCWSLIL